MNDLSPPVPDNPSSPFPEPPPLPAPPVASRPEFHGSGGEFFRIWIVNMFLTLVTLGFYIPWAKVRTRRYFYRQTRLGGENFDYLADPKKLFIGYLIVATLFILYSLGEYISIWVVPAVLILVMIAYPWIRWKSARFFAANSSYRHLTYSFNGTLGDAYKVFLGLPIAAGLTFGILYPLAAFRGRRYYFENFSYGNSRSEFRGSLSFFYKVYLIAFGILAALVLLVSVIFGAGMGALMHNASNQDWSEEQIEESHLSEPSDTSDLSDSSDFTDDMSEFEDFDEYDEEWESEIGNNFDIFTSVIVALVVLIYLGFFAGLAVMRVIILNHCWSNTRFNTPGGVVTMKSMIHPIRYIWIIVSNLFLCIVTLGIYIPFAKVRLHRYRLACLAVYDVHLVETVEGTERANVGALGETASDWLDFDFGL